MAEAVRRGVRLRRSFFARDARVVARELLGAVVVHDDPERGLVAARIVETEAYLGRDDAASHAFRGPTPRSAAMFGPPARLYVYFTYGMHWCTNVVCDQDGTGAAVLLRAAAPVAGLDAMRARRPAARHDRELCAGPARLSAALGLDGRHNEASLLRGPVRIVDDGTPLEGRVATSPRIGISEGVEHLWRYYVEGDAHVSRRDRPRRPGASRTNR